MGDKKYSDSYLKQLGVDAHEVKKDYGCEPVSRFDIYKGETVVIRDKKGKLAEDTGMSHDDFVDTYGNSKDKEKDD